MESLLSCGFARQFTRGWGARRRFALQHQCSDKLYFPKPSLPFAPLRPAMFCSPLKHSIVRKTLRKACITAMVVGMTVLCQSAWAQRFGARSVRGGGVGIGISISPLGISIGRTNAPSRYPVPVYGSPRGYTVPRSYGSVSGYRSPAASSIYGRSYGVTPYTRGGVTISRAVPLSPSYRSPSPYGSGSLYGSVSPYRYPSSSSVRSSTTIMVPRTSSGYRAVSPYSQSPYSGSQYSSQYSSPSRINEPARSSTSTPSMSIPAYRPPVPPSAGSRVVRAEAIPSALRDAASRLQRSLDRRRDSEVWLNYLKPDQIIETIDAGGSILPLKDLLGGYNGVSNNRQLSHVYNADGFSDIRGLLGRIDEYEQSIDAQPYDAPQNDVSSSVLAPAPPTIELTDPELDQKGADIEMVAPPLPDGPAELPPAIPDSADLQSL